PKIITVLKSYTLPSINRDQIACLAENLKHKGVNQKQKRERQLIVSLTSYPARMYDIHLCLYSLLVQDFKPDRLILWLAKEQFPDRDDDVPKRVLELKQWGLEIRWCEDTQSYKKLIPTLQEFPDSVIVTADDDIYYPSDWLRNLWDGHCEQPEAIIAHRCRKIYLSDDKIEPYHSWTLQNAEQSPSYLNFMTGAGGVLYPPKCLHENVLNKSTFTKLCPHGDDIWFWCMAVLNGTRIAIPRNLYKELVYINPLREANAIGDGTLFSINNNGGNDVQLANLLDAYPEIRGKLMQEANDFVAVSIIIPIYNAEKYLHRCLKSVMRQTLRNIEVICTNDGSTDNSLNILNEWEKKYPNLKIINQPNAGSAAARNSAIRIARGEYIGFVDADDEVSKDYFELLYNAAISEGADISATSKLIICHPNGSQQIKNSGLLQKKTITSIAERGKIVITTGVTCNKIYRRNLLMRHSIFYPEVRCAGEDNYFCAMTALHANRIAVSHKAKYLYYMNSTSQTHVNKGRKDFHIIEFYKEIEQKILSLSLPLSEKKQWLEIINKRKEADYKEFYNGMMPEFKEEFKINADAHLKVIYLNEEIQQH
ncbi:MAG: glycosyltransferase family 2 protein, partial [Akkermansia sp.]|nr:glycosyltransferase family 2 protein [Akkermansia sp.]